jgi:hypothetical protein
MIDRSDAPANRAASDLPEANVMATAALAIDVSTLNS